MSLITQLKELAKEQGIEFDEEILSKAAELASFKFIPKNTILALIGDNADKAGIVLEGVTRAYYIDGNGNDITRGFGARGRMCMDEGLFGYSGYICMWETLSDSTVMYFDVRELKSLIMSSEDLKAIWIVLLEKALRYKMYRENGFLVENATERYLHFRRAFPDLADSVPKKHIATYLGITPESLSRIRSAMKEE